MNIDGTLGRIKEMEGFLEKKGNKLLLYHTDADGLCSAALFLRHFEGFEAMPREGPIITKGFYESLKGRQLDTLAVVDIPLDQESAKLEKLLELNQNLNIVIIDHHIVEKDMNSKRVVHINPRFGGKCYVPASAVVYRIIEKLGKNPEEHIWLSAAGIIGDHGVEDTKPIMDRSRMLCPADVGDDPYNCRCDNVGRLITASITMRGLDGAEYALGRLMQAKSIDDFLADEQLNEWKVVVQEEIEKVIADAESASEGGNMIIYEIKSKLNVTAVVSTVLATRHPEKTIVLAKKNKDRYKISLRCQTGKINLGAVVKEAVAGIGSGGGHEKAAGAITDDWEELKRRLLEKI